MKFFKSGIAGISLAALAACGGGGSDSPPAPTLAAFLNPSFTGFAGDLLTLDGGKSTAPTGKTLSYSWRITQKGQAVAFFEGAPRLGTAVLNDPLAGKQTALTVNANFCGLAAGSYVVELTVSDGSQTSAATTQVTLTKPNRTAPRDATSCEVENFKILLFSVFAANMGLKSPASFKLINEPKWSYYSSIGKPYEAAISFDFEAANSFGVLLQKRAICPYKLQSNSSGEFFWATDLNSALQICTIV
jgi:hypothetical protein